MRQRRSNLLVNIETSLSLRLVTRFVLESLSHEFVCRLAKRRGFAKNKDTPEWQIVEKTRALYKKLDAQALAVLLFEAILLGSVAHTNSSEDDLLGNAVTPTKVNLKALRNAVASEEKGKDRKKSKPPKAKTKAK